MKKQVRVGIFESNSSSCHTLTFCTKKEWEDWRDGLLLYDTYEEELVSAKEYTPEEREAIIKGYYDRHKKLYYKNYEDLTPEEKTSLIEEIEEHGLLSKARDTYRFKSYEDWINDYDYEHYSKEYTSSKGETVIAFGKYGYN